MKNILIQRLHITKAGEQHFFQINIPRQAVSITGIELGVVMNSNVFLADRSLSSNHWLSMKRNKLLGEVQLQTANPSNFFYRDELIQEDINIGITDFVAKTKDIVIIDDPTQMVANIDDALVSILHIGRKKGLKNYWKSHQFTHGNKKEFDVVNIGNENVIYGCFKDVIGRVEKQHINYIVQVYVLFND
jgi:hypothetical protein